MAIWKIKLKFVRVVILLPFFFAFHDFVMFYNDYVGFCFNYFIVHSHKVLEFRLLLPQYGVS